MATHLRIADNHSNPWVVNLVHCFQDANFLYLVMEYMPGGDLMEHLIRRDIFVRRPVTVHCRT